MNNIKLLPSLLVFAEVAQQSSFTQAAQKLGMSKSAVSQQVKRLEAQIGQQLLSRHTRGMSLTAVGQKLLARCELLQDQVQLAFEEINSGLEKPSGVFAITIAHSCERQIVIPALNQLCIEFPDIEPKILVSDEVKDLIDEQLDVALSFGELKDSNYRALPIGTVGEIICASSAVASKLGDIKTIEDLPQRRWISAPWQQNTVSLYRNNLLSEEIKLNIDFKAYTNTLTTAVEMVLHEMGIALLPKFAVQPHLDSGQMVQILPTHQGRLWPFYMVHRFSAEKPIHVTRFYQLVKHFFDKSCS
ncbi:MAG: LysR family transcriptional regulator [Pseudomonadales bacterium]|nr:LysR family transcriptional regulator [Pseudomonadales bacterium]